MTTARQLATVAVRLDGRVLGDDDLRCLTGLRVQERLCLPTVCELVFRDPPGPLAPAEAAAVGTTLDVAIAGHELPLFEGDVTAVQHVHEPAGGRAVVLRAYDVLHRLRKRQSVKGHVHTTVAKLAAELTGDLGIEVQATADGPGWDLVVQHRQSDFELLAELAERSGLAFHLRQRVLHLFDLEGIGPPAHLDLGETLREARFEVNSDRACRRVAAAGWGPDLASTRQAEATSPRSAHTAAAEADPTRFGGDGAVHLVDLLATADEQLDAAAQLELDRRTAGEVTVWAVADGDPRLRPGGRVVVGNVHDSVAGRYVLTEVDHLVDGDMGYVSELSTRPPATRPRPEPVVATVARVSQVADPDGHGRVRAVLPTYGDVETGWMQVVFPGAGADKGFVSVPDVGDDVLVLLAGEDPAQGIVVGGLYGDRSVPDPGIDSDRVRRHTWVSAGGQRVTLDDVAGMVRVENASGSYLELHPDHVTIHAATDITIEAPGRAVTIRAAAIDMETA